MSTFFINTSGFNNAINLDGKQINSVGNNIIDRKVTNL